MFDKDNEVIKYWTLTIVTRQRMLAQSSNAKKQGWLVWKTDPTVPYALVAHNATRFNRIYDNNGYRSLCDQRRCFQDFNESTKYRLCTSTEVYNFLHSRPEAFQSDENCCWTFSHNQRHQSGLKSGGSWIRVKKIWFFQANFQKI